MDDQEVDAGVGDTLQARLDGVRARHEAGEYDEADLEILLLGTRAQWAREHPPPRAEADGASASPRPVHNEELLPQANYVAPTKQGRQQGQRGLSGGGGGWKSSNAKSTEGADRGKSAKRGDWSGSGSS
ncbi:unnamed protein product [Closterium sp. Naga37s-1]|nr:unnamed protein product [Closterium sp. Naga37s-1]